jgi:DNA-binding response OmpR family regulator
VNKKILIYDEERFAKVCDALLQLNGHPADSIVHGVDPLPLGDLSSYSLVITSFPYGSALFLALKKAQVPILVLSDMFSADLISAVCEIKNSCCMIKPVDFGEFCLVVQRVINGCEAEYGEL